MKKLDKLILSSFIGPFILTFLVVVFILLTQHMLKYFDDIIGKGLGIDVIGQLLFYFAIFMTPIAMPLAVLLSTLIAFGNLGEHFELTAVKSAGISLVRALVPIFFFVLGLTVVAFYVNNNLVPKAALEAYSLLYDIKQKKPALDLREGSFYDGIPDMSIKVNKKFPDGVTIGDVLIYDHRKHDGNREVTVADSGKMYTIMNEQYLKLELFNGYNYTEGANNDVELAGQSKSSQKESFTRTKFSKTQVVFDLSSFALERTEKKWFQGNRIMRNLSELQSDMDSINNERLRTRLALYSDSRTLFNYFSVDSTLKIPAELKRFKSLQDSLPKAKPVTIASEPKTSGKDSLKSDSVPPIVVPDIKRNASIDSLKKRPFREPRIKKNFPKGIDRVQEARNKFKNRNVLEQEVARNQRQTKRNLTAEQKSAAIDSIFRHNPDKSIFESAANAARTGKTHIENNGDSLEEYDADQRVFLIQWHKILASSLACIVMFLIGAPLGAIIKKGGLGVPFLVSILFFIIYYLLTMTGEKWAKQGFIDVPIGVWAADVILFVIGLLFLRQARLDARLFEADFYLVAFDNAKKWLIRRKILPETAS